MSSGVFYLSFLSLFCFAFLYEFDPLAFKKISVQPIFDFLVLSLDIIIP